MRPMNRIRSIRNIGIIAHIDAGKTTTTERFIYYSGREHRHGDVDDGNTVTDFDPEEADRGITIYSAATSISWLDHTINIIDTPGHVDFTAEVERALRVLDGAVTILDGVAGVQAQTETVWRQADRYRVPRVLFVNKLDRAGADFDLVLEHVQSKLRGSPVAVTVPDRCGGDFDRVLDLLSGEWVTFSGEDEGKSVAREPASGGGQELLVAGRSRIVETLADHHDSELVERLVELHLEGRPIAAELFQEALREATLAGAVQPAYAGSSLHNRGVQPLMDGIVAFLPSPADCLPAVGLHPETEEELERSPVRKAPFAALAFKTIAEPSVDLTFLRVYSGVAKGRTKVLNPGRRRTERIGPTFYLQHGRHRSEVSELGPGDIAVVTGLKFTVTGDTLCDPDHPIVFEAIMFPETVISMTIEPGSSAERAKLDDALVKLARDDPTFRVGEDQETGEMVISGMGELHLEIIKNKLLRDFHVAARIGQPRVTYRESVTAAARGSYGFEQVLGERRRFARVELRVEPAPGERTVDVTFDDEVSEAVIPKPMRAVVIDAIQGRAAGGFLLGYPFIGLRVVVVDGGSDGADATDATYAAAAAHAFAQAIEELSRQGAVTLLEPVMRIEVLVSEEFLGNVINDLNTRRAMISDMSGDQELRVVQGKVPLREMFSYTTDLRSMTHGKATHVMEPEEYAPLPGELQREMLGRS
jgi:elongation factor G